MLFYLIIEDDSTLFHAPSVIASELEHVAADAINTTFHPTTPRFRELIDRFLADRNGRIVLTGSKGLTGVGFPRKGSGRGANKTTGWEDIAAMTTGSVSRTIIDDTLPGGPVERIITYEAPFDRCDRVGDYRVVWEFFKGGKQQAMTTVNPGPTRSRQVDAHPAASDRPKAGLSTKMSSLGADPEH